MADRDSPRIFTPDYYQRLRDLEVGAWWNAGMRDIAARVLDTADLPESGSMLDIGCGSGQTMAWFAAGHPAWRTIGFDVAIEGLTAARTFGVTRVLQASALDLPVPSQSVDLVISLDVLQHLPLGGGDSRALAEIVRVLRPGGHVFLRTNAQSFPRTPDDARFQFHKYEPEELRAKLDAAGLRVMCLSRVNALLGMAEIPRELRVRRQEHSYHGVLSTPAAGPGWMSPLKRAWLRFEGRAVSRGMVWPLGRTIVALARRS